MNRMKNLNEIKNILNKNKNYLKEKYSVTKIEIFGSFARGEQKLISDVDILVEFEKSVSLLTIVSLENYLSDLIGINADVVPKKNIRAELRDNIIKEAIPI